MGWTYIGYASGTEVASNTTVATGTTLNISAGDLLVTMVMWLDTTTTVTSINDGSNNAHTVEAVDAYSTTHCAAAAYVLNGDANASATITATLGAAKGDKSIQVLQFTPSAGTVSKDQGPGYNQRTDDFASSDNITTTGSDMIVVGMQALGNSTAIYNNNWNIGSTAATIIATDAAEFHAAYRAAAISADNSICELNAYPDSIGMIMAFTIEAASSTAPTGNLSGPLGGPLGGVI